MNSGNATVDEFSYGPNASPIVYSIEVTAENGVTTKTYTISASQPPT